MKRSDLITKAMGLITAAFVVGMLSGCRTMAGLGEDIADSARGVQRSIWRYAELQGQRDRRNKDAQVVQKYDQWTKENR